MRHHWRHHSIQREYINIVISHDERQLTSWSHTSSLHIIHVQTFEERPDKIRWSSSTAIHVRRSRGQVFVSWPARHLQGQSTRVDAVVIRFGARIRDIKLDLWNLDGTKCRRVAIMPRPDSGSLVSCPIYSTENDSLE